jgi:hypothetical protein
LSSLWQSPLAIASGNRPGNRAAICGGVPSAGADNFSGEFRAATNSACALDEMSIATTIGRVIEINGWDRGPSNEGVVQVVWTPTCTTRTTNYVVASRRGESAPRRSS